MRRARVVGIALAAMWWVGCGDVVDSDEPEDEKPETTADNDEEGPDDSWGERNAREVNDREVNDGEVGEEPGEFSWRPDWLRDPGSKKEKKEKKEKKKGELGVVAALNHPPKIVKASHDPGRFVGCEARATVCVSASDPELDPLRFTWSQLGGPPLVEGPSVVSHDEHEGVTTSCVDVVGAPAGADYLLEVLVQDLVAGPEGPITMEEWFTQEGYDETLSRASLQIPWTVVCGGESAL